jgi:hypothetical protein
MYWNDIEIFWDAIDNRWEDAFGNPINFGIFGAPPAPMTAGQQTILTTTKRNLNEADLMFDPYIQSILEHIDYLKRMKRLTRFEENSLAAEIQGRMAVLLKQ